MSAAAWTRSRAGRAVGRLDPDAVARPAFVPVLVASGLLLVVLTRGTTFWVDEWNFITSRRAHTFGTYFSPYQGHLSAVPIAIYQLMISVFGIGSYAPYRILLIILNLVVAGLVFAYARRRVGDLLALLLAALIAFLGPGWQNIMWPFQISWLIVTGAGIGALMLLERDERLADAVACGLVLVALGSTSFGLAFAIGIAVDVALSRPWWQDAWIVGIPLLLYVGWAVHYHPTSIAWSSVTAFPWNLAQAGSAMLSGLTGLSGVTPFNQDGTTALTYGAPLLAGAVVAGIWLVLLGRFYARAVSLLTVLMVFVAMVTVGRIFEGVLTSRYVYVYCVLGVLLIAELARGIHLSRAFQGVLCVLALGAVVSNIGIMRGFNAYLRHEADLTKGALGALHLDRDRVAGATLLRVGLFPYMRLTASAYLGAARELGNAPMYSATELQRAPSDAQAAADSQLLADGAVQLSDTRPQVVEPSQTPSAAATVDGTATTVGSCLRFLPAALPLGGSSSLTLSLRSGSVTVAADRAPVAIFARRFAITATQLGTLKSGDSIFMTFARDAASTPWHLQLQTTAPVRVCALP